MTPREGTRYISPQDFSIHLMRQTPFDATIFAVEIYGENGRRARKEAHIRHRNRLASVHIEDEKSQQSLFSQAISAINGYPKERRKLHPDFQPFAYFTEPNGTRFLIGEINGEWDLAHGAFRLKSITIQDVCETMEKMDEMIGTIQSLNPGVPKVASDSFMATFEAFKAMQPASE